MKTKTGPKAHQPLAEKMKTKTGPKAQMKTKTKLSAMGRSALGGKNKKRVTKKRAKKCSGLLLACHRVTDCCQEYKNTLLVSLLALSLVMVFSGMGPSPNKTTFFKANKSFINDYTGFLADSYGSMVGQTFEVFGGTVYQLKNVKFALADTFDAYAALFSNITKPMAKLFVSSGNVLAKVSHAISTPARVMAQSVP